LNTFSQLLFGAKRTALIESRSNRVFLSATYFFYFGLLGIFVPYVGLFLDDRGFTSSQIGSLLAVTALFRILGPNLWANVADSSGRVAEVLRLGCLLAFIAFTAVFVVYDYWLLTLTFCLMMMFWTAVLPQLEVITIQATQNAKGGYGKLRLWGSIGFIACSLLAGSLIDIYGPSIIAAVSCASLFLLYISSLLIVSPERKERAVHKTGGDWKQAFSLVFVVFILSNTLLQVSFGAYYNFFALYMHDLAYTGFQTGLFIAVGVLAEVIIFIFAVRLVSRFEVLNLLAFSILLTGVRWFGLAFFPDQALIIVMCQMLHALSFALSHVASVYFLTHHFSTRFQSRAQAIYVSITFGVGSAIGSYIAGYLWQDGQGASTSFIFSGVVAFIAGIALMLLIVYQKFTNTRAI
jgi:PPP family 3-phenylpropionic acid transporter